MGKAPKQAPELDPVQREAVAWVQRLVTGQPTADDADALMRWRAQSPVHAAAFAEASRVWNDVGSAGRSLRRRGGERAAGLADFGPQRRDINRRFILAGGLATMAATAAYAVVRPPLGLWPSLSELSADYRTGTGEQRNVTVAGHVSIRMNTQTSIAIQSAEGGVDRIELVTGEASFATPSQERRSFAVVAAGGRTVSEGARFDVRHMREGAGAFVCVTCFEGDVRVMDRTDTITLGPKQQVRYDATGMGRAVAVDPERASDWQRGIVVFHATPLVDVVEEINRYRPGRIILMSAALGRKQVNGRFRIDQMNEILSRLEQAFDARVQTLPGGVVLLS